jgi:hypothetical protein
MMWVVRIVIAAVALYATAAGALAWAMVQTPERFGQIMTHVPMVVAWGVLPGPRIWSWARSGHLAEGDEAPAFTLPTLDHSDRVSLATHRGQRPVVLVFGSYS